MARSSSILVVLILLSLQVYGQDRYFVFFKDRNNSPYSISTPAAFLSARSIERRQDQNIAIVEEDLPVNPDYVAQVKTAGANTFFSSRWWNGVLVEADHAAITAVNALSFVRESVLVAPGEGSSSGRKPSIREKKNQTSDQPVNQFQLQQIGLDEMHAAGYRGEGVLIAVLDSGFPGVNASAPFASMRNEGRIKQTFNFVTRSADVYSTSDDHGTEVLSVIGAYSEGSYTGGAHKADFLLYVTEFVPTEFRVEEYNWTVAAERADSAGVDVINSSLGYNTFDDGSMDYEKSELTGEVAVITRAARKAIEKGIIVVCSAGNEGANSWRLVTPPADAKGILSTGAINMAGTITVISSRGPTADNRIKPDVVALGSGTSVVRANGSLGAASGTSLASPLIASLAAGVRQAFPDLTAAEIYDVITKSADRALNPDNTYGYGLPHFRAIINYMEETVPTATTISVFPNPITGDTMYIQMTEPTTQPVLIDIYDSVGKRVAKSELFTTWLNAPLQFDISAFTSGLYFVRISSGSQTTALKFVRL